MFMVMVVNGDDAYVTSKGRFFTQFKEARDFLKKIVNSDEYDYSHTYTIYKDNDYSMELLVEWLEDYDTGEPYEHFYCDPKEY